MSVKRIIGILIAVGLDIITVIIGITTIFVNLFSGNFVGAGLTLLIVLALVIIFPILGIVFTKDKKPALPDKQMIYDDNERLQAEQQKALSLKEVKRIASRYQYGFYLGKTAKAIVNQANLVGTKIDEARQAVNNRFEVNSITWDRYMGVVDAASNTAVNNLDTMARRISVLDEKEYSSLANPLKRIGNKQDNSGRLEFYQENKQSIERCLTDNQEMFNKLDRLSIELMKSADDSTGSDAVVQDIEDITNQVKFYH
ncbi:MAG: hypothetical protein K5644_06270 [Lachnospiraceae bacterium]|nr:hypothetical protein [Lachnospiraceae bacterium]